MFVLSVNGMRPLFLCSHVRTLYIIYYAADENRRIFRLLKFSSEDRVVFQLTAEHLLFK